jgi:hypothetical protein
MHCPTERNEKMRKLYDLMVLAALFIWAMAAYAQCPVQETAVFYVNGVDNKESDADKSRRRLRQELLSSPDVQPECVRVGYAYNTNEPLFLDFLEAAIQKSDELDFEISDFWRYYFRFKTVGSAAWFDNLVADRYSKWDLAEFLLGDQLQEHLRLYRGELAMGRRVILVAHSQGNLYANETWRALTPDEQSQVRLVAVATPSDEVADGSERYTTLEEDGVAKRFFFFALPANAANEEPCSSEWECHGFKESYLSGQNSHDRIVNQVVSLLPENPPPVVTKASIEGVVYYQDETIAKGAIVTLAFSDDSEVFWAFADSEGRFRFVGIDPCECVLRASQGYWSGQKNVQVSAGEVLTIGLIMEDWAAPW